MNTSTPLERRDPLPISPHGQMDTNSLIWSQFSGTHPLAGDGPGNPPEALVSLLVPSS